MTESKDVWVPGLHVVVTITEGCETVELDALVVKAEGGTVWLRNRTDEEEGLDNMTLFALSECRTYAVSPRPPGTCFARPGEWEKDV